MLLQILIFVTGAAVLALELLASRVMTPYFGVSLYIWSGILSITLIALASGYWLGGRMATGRNGAKLSVDHLCTRYLLMPVVASVTIVVACLLYPHVFPVLARHDLVSGAFLACLLLLFAPLLATSAMNPLLVAIRLSGTGPGRAADAGAGKVFFISTLGSVAGVFVTAFGLIPNLRNFTSLLVLAVLLGALPLLALTVLPQGGRSRRTIGGLATGALLVAAGLLAGADALMARMWPVAFVGSNWTLEASVGSLFGTVKVIRSDPIDAQGRFVRTYFQDGLIQNRVLSDGQSLSLYTYALETFARAYRPELKTALVLGLGAGIVPMRLAAKGVVVDAVEIDPASIEVATRHFGFDRSRVRTHLADARTFLGRCGARYDVVVVDLFHGDGVPEYLLTREFFRDLRGCLALEGVAVFNSFADLGQPLPYAHFLATLRAEFPEIVLYRPDEASSGTVNSFVIASPQRLPDAVRITLADVLPRHADSIDAMLRNPRRLDQELLRGGLVATDAHSVVARDLARSQMSYRQSVVQDLPAAFFMN